MGGRAKISTATLTAGRITYARQWQRQCCVLNILICHPLKAMSVRRPVMLNYTMSQPSGRLLTLFRRCKKYTVVVANKVVLLFIKQG